MATVKRMPLFSRQYAAELQADRDFVDSLSQPMRGEIQELFRRYDHNYRSPQGGSLVGDLPELFRQETGKPLTAHLGDGFQPVDDAQSAIASGARATVLDLIQIFVRRLSSIACERGRRALAELNDVFTHHRYPWRLRQDGYRRAEPEILEQQADRALGLLTDARFTGPLQEYEAARDHLAKGDTKSAIRAACNAFESTLKSVLEEPRGTAKELSQELLARGYFDDLPEAARRGFPDQVFMALPFIGNKNGRHGQGRDVVDVPKPYAELAVTLAGAFITFCLTKSDDERRRDVPIDR